MKMTTCWMSVSCEHEAPDEGVGVGVGMPPEPPPQPWIATAASSAMPAAAPNFRSSRRFIRTPVLKRIRATSWLNGTPLASHLSIQFTSNKKGRVFCRLA